MHKTNWLALCLVLASCAAPRPVTSGGKNDGWSPLAPATLGASVDASQVLRVAFGERETTLNCAVSIRPEQLTIVGMTALGMRAFTVKYDGVQVAAEALVQGPEMLPPERLLNDVQFTYWPLKVLQTHLAGTGYEVSEPAHGTRRLKRNGRVIVEAHYASDDPWNGRAWLVNLEFGYSLSIESKRNAKNGAETMNPRL